MSDTNTNVNGVDMVTVITAVITVALKYGMPFVMELFSNLNNGTITQADIDALKITKKPEDYLTNHNKLS